MVDVVRQHGSTLNVLNTTAKPAATVSWAKRAPEINKIA